MSHSAKRVRYVLKRLLQAIPVILAILVVNRVTMRHLLAACVLVVVAGLAWVGIQHEPLSGVLLPEAVNK